MSYHYDDLRSLRADVRLELDNALESFADISTMRETKANPAPSDTLNREFLAANTRLAKASREYEAYNDGMKEWCSMLSTSTLSCEEAHDIFPYHSLQEKMRRQRTQRKMLEERLRDNEDQILELELEREDLVKKANAIPMLSEQVHYVEHLNEALKQQLAFSLEFAQDVERHLQSTQAQLRSYQAQLSFAKATAMQLKDENKGLRRLVGDMDYAMAGAEDRITRLESNIERYGAENVKLRRRNDHLQQEFNEIHGQASYVTKKNSELQREVSDLRTPQSIRTHSRPVDSILAIRKLHLTDEIAAEELSTAGAEESDHGAQENWRSVPSSEDISEAGSVIHNTTHDEGLYELEADVGVARRQTIRRVEAMNYSRPVSGGCE